jgi:hypothetical protein
MIDIFVFDNELAIWQNYKVMQGLDIYYQVNQGIASYTEDEYFSNPIITIPIIINSAEEFRALAIKMQKMLNFL